MKFGTILPHIGPLAAGPDALDSLLSVAQQAEALGFDSLWVGDHVVLPTAIKPRYPYNDTGEFPLPAEAALLEPLTVLGFLTGVTRRVRLGPSVLVLPHRNPILTAKMFASLDVLSRGRIIFGAGIGWMEEEISLLGAPFKRRGALSDEYLRAMRELWTSPDPQFEGEFCRFSGIKCEPKPLQNPLPIWIGGHSARAMRRIVEFGDGWIAVPKSLAVFQDGMALLREAADRGGRDLNAIEIMIGLLRTTSVDEFIEAMKPYQDLGYESFMVPLPFWGTDLQSVLGQMDDFADKVGMQPV